MLTLTLLGRYLVHNNYCNKQLEDLDIGNKQCLFPLLSTKKSSLLKDISRNMFGKDMTQICFLYSSVSIQDSHLDIFTVCKS